MGQSPHHVKSCFSFWAMAAQGSTFLVEIDQICSFVRAIQYAFNLGMILFRSRVSHSLNSL
jgi:hypothetical protein